MSVAEADKLNRCTTQWDEAMLPYTAHDFNRYSKGTNWCQPLLSAVFMFLYHRRHVWIFAGYANEAKIPTSDKQREI